MKRIVLFSVMSIACFFFLRRICRLSFGEKTVNLIGPKNDLITLDTTLTFLWEKHIDATSYRLQIATPDFESIERLPIDSVITKDYVELTLKPGTYEWRVRPENRGSVGIYTSRKLVILDQKVDEK
ncbi:hypothetical protein OKW96_18085 [Sphingobacterium sp. KU25419]|nr:hypothetical protein OKW96_18085 [Sphingobacterium sp. KU25419]